MKQIKSKESKLPKLLSLIVIFFSFVVDAIHVPEAYNVSGTRIILRDIFQFLPEDIDNKVGDVVLFQQYAPGQKVHLTPRHLKNIAKQYGIALDISNSHPGVHIHKIAWEPSSDDLIKMLKDFDANFDEENVTIELIQVPDIKRDIGDKDTCAFKDFQQKGAQNFQVTLQCKDTMYRIIGKKTRYQDVPVLSRAFRAGEVVGPEDILWVKLPDYKIQGRHVQDIDHVIGRFARRPLGPRTLLLYGDLKKPTLVKKGDIVDVQYKNGCIKLTLKTRSLEDGALGDTISLLGYTNGTLVKNINKKGRKKTIMARITGPNQAVMDT